MRAALRFVLLLTLVLQAWCGAKLTYYDRTLWTGKLAYLSWEPDKAINFLERALSIDDSDSDTWRRYGDAAFHMHDPDAPMEDVEIFLQKAWTGYAGAVLRSPGDSSSWIGLAEVALRRSEALEGEEESGRERRESPLSHRAVALAAARLGAELDPAGFYWMDMLAMVHQSLGNLDRAEKAYAESARMMPAASYHLWGSGRRFRGRVYEAILGGLEEGAERSPSFERAALLLGIARFARVQGDPETAVEYMKRAEQQARRSSEKYAAMWEMSTLLQRLGRFEEALEALEKAKENLVEPTKLSESLGILEMRVGRMQEACAHLREALRDASSDDDLRLQAARACEKALEPQLAEQILQGGFVIPPDDLVLARALVDLHRRQGREWLADHLVRRWATEHPYSEELRRWAQQGRPAGK